MGEPLEYSTIINTCPLNQRGTLAKHMLAYEVLQIPGWDIAFPDNPISHIDAIVFNHDFVYKFQVKHVHPIWRQSKQSRKYTVPLRNHVKYKYRKDQTLKDRSKAYKYFNHGIDCVYAYDSTAGWMTKGGMFVWSTTPHKRDLSVYTVSIDQPRNNSTKRVYVPELQNFNATQRQHEHKKYARNLRLGTGNG